MCEAEDTLAAAEVEDGGGQVEAAEDAQPRQRRDHHRGRQQEHARRGRGERGQERGGCAARRPGFLFVSQYSTVQYSIAQYSTWLYHTPVTETEVRESARLATSSHAHHHPASSRGSPR